MNYNFNIEPTRKKYRRDHRILNMNTVSLFIIILCLGLSFFSTFKMISAHNKQKALLKTVENLKASNNLLASKNVKLEQGIKTVQETYDKTISNMRIAHLTFDDGPSNNTMKLLDILDNYNAKATFFVNYKEGYDDVYREIVNRGHVLANHTASHNYKKIYSSVTSFIDDIELLDKKLEEITGQVPSKILRFPGGSNTEHAHRNKDIMTEIIKSVKERGYTYFDWNVDSTDACKMTQDKNVIIDNVLNGSLPMNTANILMHDTNVKYTTLEAMPEILNGLKAQGYIFKPLNHDSADIRFVE